MKRYIAGALAGLILGIGGVALMAYDDNKATKFYSGSGTGDLSVGDLKLNGLDILDSGGTARVTLATSSPEITLTGNVSVTGDHKVAGQKIETATNYTMGVGTTATPTSAFGLFTSTGGAITITATPTIATTTATNGERFTIFSTTATLTFNDNDNEAGVLLELGSSTRALGVGDILVLRFWNGSWYEEGFYNN